MELFPPLPHLQLHAVLLKLALHHHHGHLHCSLTGLLARLSTRAPLHALAVFSHLYRRGGGGARAACPPALRACGRARALWCGAAVHALVAKAGLGSGVYVANHLLHMYSCCGAEAMARGVFDEMRVKDVVSWSAMIEGYVICNCPPQALIVFHQMRSSNVAPNSVTFVSLLSACTQLCNLSIGRSIHSHLIANKIELALSLGTALVRMYAKCGRIDEASKVFNSMGERNLQTWTTMISGLADHGCAEEAIILFSQMEASGIRPDSTAFSSILSACSHLGMVDEGWMYFNRMVNELKIKPRVEHYGCMVDLLGRAGLVEAAYEFMKNMPIVPNSVILRSFLGSCRKHGGFCGSDRELNQLMNRLIQEEPDLGSNYVITANVSILSNNWSDAAKLRGIVLEGSARKTPGCTWMEINRRGPLDSVGGCSG